MPAEHADSGTAAAANEGLQHCRGEYLARMAADDVSLPTRLAEQVAFLDSHAAVGLVGLGLAVSRVEHPAADPVGDALYAAFVVALIAITGIESAAGKPLAAPILGRWGGLQQLAGGDVPEFNNMFDVVGSVMKGRFDLTDAEVAEYMARYDIPVNPLLAEGYGSIGCWPCTRKVRPGEDPRAGRWAMFDKTECGLHK